MPTEFIVTVTRCADDKSEDLYTQKTADETVLKRVIAAVNVRPRRRRKAGGTEA